MQKYDNTTITKEIGVPTKQIQTQVLLELQNILHEIGA